MKTFIAGLMLAFSMIDFAYAYTPQQCKGIYNRVWNDCSKCTETGRADVCKRGYNTCDARAQASKTDCISAAKNKCTGLYNRVWNDCSKCTQTGNPDVCKRGYNTCDSRAQGEQRDCLDN